MGGVVSRPDGRSERLSHLRPQGEKKLAGDHQSSMGDPRETIERLLAESQGKNLSVTVLCVPYSLGSGRASNIIGDLVERNSPQRVW